MKTTLTTLILLAALSVTAETKTIKRNFIEGENTFVVEYEYDPDSSAMVPLTFPLGKPHYGATIRVTLHGQKFGNEFDGQVVPGGGCFEDTPGDMVDKARHAQPKVKPVTTWLTNNLDSTSYFTSTTNTLTWITNTGAYYTMTNTPIDTNVLYRASYDDRWNYGYKPINLSGVTNLVQLCAKIGHVWCAGLPPKHQANDPQLWRHCILCEKRQYHSGDWK